MPFTVIAPPVNITPSPEEERNLNFAYLENRGTAYRLTHSGMETPLWAFLTQEDDQWVVNIVDNSSVRLTLVSPGPGLGVFDYWGWPEEEGEPHEFGTVRRAVPHDSAQP